jgi:ornithine cyclodeaminase/alanine dehydrogenase-like protein (mu-crystallin family)
MSKIINPDLQTNKHLCDILFETMRKNQPNILEETLAAGVPITYMDDDNNVMKEFPDKAIVMLLTYHQVSEEHNDN